MSKQWINALKLSIIEENIEALGVQINNFPKQFLKEDLEEITALIQEAITLMEKKKFELSQDMERLRQIRTYAQTNY